MTSAAPEPPPRPPGDLAARRPLEIKLQSGEMLHRFFTAAHDPIYFDWGRDGRLNAPGDSYGVLYAAKAPQGAFAETFLRNPGLTQLPTDLLVTKAYVTLQVLRPLKLVRMTGPGLARIGATTQVAMGVNPMTFRRSGRERCTSILAAMTESPTTRAMTTRPYARRSLIVQLGRSGRRAARRTLTRTGFGTSPSRTALVSRPSDQ